MARESESRTQAQHITDVIFAAGPNTKLGRFITHLAGSAQCRRKFIHYLRKNRLKLHTIKFADENGNLTNFDEKADEEALSELYALDPFLNHNQNLIGPKAQGYEDRKMDIMKFTREDFLDYVYDRFNIDDPGSWDEEDIDQQKRRVTSSGRTCPAHHPQRQHQVVQHQVQKEEVSYYEEEYC